MKSKYHLKKTPVLHCSHFQSLPPSLYPEKEIYFLKKTNMFWLYFIVLCLKSTFNNSEIKDIQIGINDNVYHYMASSNLKSNKINDPCLTANDFLQSSANVLVFKEIN